MFAETWQRQFLLIHPRFKPGPLQRGIELAHLGPILFRICQKHAAAAARLEYDTLFRVEEEGGHAVDFDRSAFPKAGGNQTQQGPSLYTLLPGSTWGMEAPAAAERSSDGCTGGCLDP